MCFFAGLDRIFRLYDHVNPGMTVDTGAHTFHMATFEYADDAAIIDEDARQGTARVTSLHGGRLHHGCRNEHLNYEKQGDAHPQDDPNECDHRG